MPDTPTPSIDWSAFRGYRRPRYTVVPNELFDQHMAELTGAELKVLLYIIRRTYGFDKSSDAISLSQLLTGIRTRDGRQLDRGTGLSKPTLLQALRSLVEKNLIIAERQQSEERGNEPTLYRLHQADDDEDLRQGAEPLPAEDDPAPGKKRQPPLVKKFDQGVGQETLPSPRSRNLTTQQKELQQTVLQEIDTSNIRKVNISHSNSSPDQTGERSIEPDSIGSALRPQTNPGSKPGDGFSSVGDLLTARHGRAGSRPRDKQQKRSDDERQQILTFIRDFALEFHDEAPLQSSVSRAYNLYQRSGIPIEAFTSFLYEARALTQEHSAGVKKVSQTHTSVWGPEKNKMAYYFAILKELVERHMPKQSALTAPADAGTPGESSLSAPQERLATEHLEKVDRKPSRKGLPDASESSTRAVSVSRRPIRRSVPPSPAIRAFIEDLGEELGERGDSPGAVDQAMDLYAQSGLSEDGFLRILAVVCTLARGARTDDGHSQLSTFFTILRQQLGLTDDHSAPGAPV